MFAEHTTVDSPRSASGGAADRAADTPSLLELADADDLPSGRGASEVHRGDGGPRVPSNRERAEPPCAVGDARASVSAPAQSGTSSDQRHLSPSEMYRPGASWGGSLADPPPLPRLDFAANPSAAGRHHPSARPSAATTLLPPPAPMAAKVGRSLPVTGSLDSEFRVAAGEVGAGASLPVLPPPMRPYFMNTRPATAESDLDNDA